MTDPAPPRRRRPRRRARPRPRTYDANEWLLRSPTIASVDAILACVAIAQPSSS